MHQDQRILSEGMKSRQWSFHWAHWEKTSSQVDPTENYYFGPFKVALRFNLVISQNRRSTSVFMLIRNKFVLAMRMADFKFSSTKKSKCTFEKFWNL